MNADQIAALELHQQARSQVSVAPLTWDPSLVASAQQYANQLAANDAGLHHSTQLNGQGENLCSCAVMPPSPFAMAAQSWYDEKQHWDGGAFEAKTAQAVGHYTQMIWNSTTHVGMAMASAASGAVYIVGRYSPGGNYIGQVPNKAESMSPAPAGNPAGPSSPQKPQKKRPQPSKRIPSGGSSSSDDNSDSDASDRYVWWPAVTPVGGAWGGAQRPLYSQYPPYPQAPPNYYPGYGPAGVNWPYGPYGSPWQGRAPGYGMGMGPGYRYSGGRGSGGRRSSRHGSSGGCTIS